MPPQPLPPPGALPWPAESRPLPQASAAGAYQPPELLRDLRLLDALELTGTTELAGRWLAVSQATVSRRYRRLADDFGLTPGRRGAKCCRFGTTVSLRQLRLAARWHRFEAGVVGLATDPLHQGLLEGIDGLLPMPQRFRPGKSWLDLVREGVIDAALVSSLELEPPQTGGEPARPQKAADVQSRQDAPRQPAAREPERLHLGHWPLELAAAPAEGARASGPARVLVPPATLAPGLRNLLGGQGLMLEGAASAVHDLAAWRRRMGAQALAAPVPSLLLGRPTGPFAGLQPLPQSTTLREHLWLLLPPEWPAVPVLQHTVDSLRQLAIAAGASPGP